MGTNEGADGIDEAELPPGRVRKLGQWTVGNSRGRVFAVSSRCRHQLADLGGGSIDEDGCLVCPWHQSTYDTRTGAMVQGPRGFFGYHGRTPGYARLVQAYSRVLRLRVGEVVRRAGRIVVR